MKFSAKNVFKFVLTLHYVVIVNILYEGFGFCCL